MTSVTKAGERLKLPVYFW